MTTMSEKLIGALGLACRARGMAVGQQAVEEALRRGKARLLLIDPSVSAGSAKQWKASAATFGVPILELPEIGLLERATGKENARVACVSDANFEKLIRRAADAE